MYWVKVKVKTGGISTIRYHLFVQAWIQTLFKKTKYYSDWYVLPQYSEYTNKWVSLNCSSYWNLFLSLQTKEGSSRILSTVEEFGQQVSKGLPSGEYKNYHAKNYCKFTANNQSLLSFFLSFCKILSFFLSFCKFLSFFLSFFTAPTAMVLVS